jgi:hypothetical protein
MELAAATQKAMLLKQMLHELHQDPSFAIAIYKDNDSCIAVSKHSMTTGRSKHMDVRYLFYQEKVESGDIEVRYCATEGMLADVLARPLASVRPNKLRNAIMGLLE